MLIPSDHVNSLRFTVSVIFRNGDIPETTAMETTRYLGAEMSNNPWSSALKHLLYSDRIYRKYSWYYLFKVYVNWSMLMYILHICLAFSAFVA